MKHFLLCLLFVFDLCTVYGSGTDSLLNVLKTAEGEARVKTMNELFRAYINSDPVTAISYARQALDLAGSIHDQKGMAAAYNNLGVSYRNQGALDNALEYYLKSLDLYTQINNAEGIATTKNNIANIYSLKKDYSQALKYFEESHNGFIGLGKSENIIGSMNNLGNLHSDLQMYDQALTFYTEAWKMSEKTPNPSADPLLNIGNLFYRQGNFQRAVEYYLRALEIVKKQNDRISELALLANLGETFVKAGQPAEAQRYLDQAQALAGELQAFFYLPQILRSQAGNFALQGKMKEAYNTMIKYDEAKDKIYGEESTRKITQMNTALELQEKEKEIEKLQQDDKMKTLQLRNIQFVVTAIVLLITTIIAISSLAMSRRKIRSINK